MGVYRGFTIFFLFYYSAFFLSFCVSCYLSLLHLPSPSLSIFCRPNSSHLICAFLNERGSPAPSCTVGNSYICRCRKTICSIAGSNHTFTFSLSADSESGIAQRVSLSDYGRNVIRKIYNSVSLSKFLDLVFFSYCHLQFHLHISKPRPQTYEEMRHARWQVIAFVSILLDIFL